MSEQEFRTWQLFHEECPLDDQSNHHLPISQLNATLFNVNRDPKKTDAVGRDHYLIFKKRSEEDAEADIEAQLLGGKW